MSLCVVVNSKSSPTTLYQPLPPFVFYSTNRQKHSLPGRFILTVLHSDVRLIHLQMSFHSMTKGFCVFVIIRVFYAFNYSEITVVLGFIYNFALTIEPIW